MVYCFGLVRMLIVLFCALLLGVACLILYPYFGVGNCGFVVESMLGCYVIIWFWCGDCFHVY